MRFKLTLIALISLAIVGWAAIVSAQDKGTIYFISPEQHDEFQVTCAKAVKGAVEGLGYKCVVLTGATEDVERQIRQMEDALTQDPVAFILSACSADAIAPTVEAVRAKGVPIIAYTREIKKTYLDFTVVTDTYAIGRLAGEGIVHLLTVRYGEPRGRVLDIMGDPGDMYTVNIEEGFQDVMADYPNIEVTKKINYGWAATTGADIAEDWIVAHPETDLLFPHGDHMSAAIAAMLERNGYEQCEILLVSTCGMPCGLEMIRAGWQEWTIQQSPFALADGFAMFLEDVLAGNPIEPGEYDVGGFDSVLSIKDFGPFLQVSGSFINRYNVDDSRWWANQVGE